MTTPEMDHLSVRPISDQDFAAAARLILEGAYNHPPNPSQEEIDSLLPHLYDEGRINFGVFDRDDTILAIGGLVKAAGRPHESTLVDIATDPNYRKMGFGKRLVLAMEKVAEQTGITHLTVQSTAEAMGFYKKLGYKPSRDDWYTKDLEIQPDASWTEFEHQDSYVVGDIVISEAHNNGEPSAVFSVGPNSEGEPSADLVAIKLVDGAITFGLPGGNIPMEKIDHKAGKINPRVLEAWLNQLDQ